MQLKSNKFKHISFEHNSAKWYAAAALAAAGIAQAINTYNQQIKQNNATDKANMMNIALQKEFAQNGIQWRVQDAKNAGINPLYALGASGANFTPSVQANDYSISANGYNQAIENIAGAGTALSNYFKSENQLKIAKKQQELEIEAAEYQNAETQAKAELFLAQADQIRQKQNATQTTPTKADNNGTMINGTYYPYGKATRIKGTGLAFSPVTQNIGTMTFADKDTFQGLGDSRAESYLIRTLMESIHSFSDEYYINKIIADLKDTGHAYGKAQNGKIIEFNLETSAGMPSIWYEIKNAPKTTPTKNTNIEKSARKAGLKAIEEYGYTD